ncbi:MAG: PaaI family thioesterase [Acidimicrobiia bacterium]
MSEASLGSFDARVADVMLESADSGGGIGEFLGFRHVEMTAGHLLAEMDVRDDLKNPFGSLHGGCLSAFVDHCLGLVFYPLIPRGSWVATTEFKLNLLKPVTAGTCLATTDVLALTKRSGVARIDITVGDDIACAAQGTVTIVPPRAP